MSVSRPFSKTTPREIRILDNIQRDVRLLRLRADAKDRIILQRARQLECLARLGYPRRLRQGELK